MNNGLEKKFDIFSEPEILKQNPEYEPILQKMSLKYLKEREGELFYREFTGELDANGYLIRKTQDQIQNPYGYPIRKLAERSDTKPFDRITFLTAIEEVLQWVREEAENK